MSRVELDLSNPLSGHCVAVALTLSLLIPPIAPGKAKKMKLHNDSEAAKKEVLKRLPIGSSIEYARDVMKMSSFQCELMRDELFAPSCEGADSRKAISCIAIG